MSNTSNNESGPGSAAWEEFWSQDHITEGEYWARPTYVEVSQYQTPALQQPLGGTALSGAIRFA